MNNLGTWIDWQYLHNAAKLLAKVIKEWKLSSFLFKHSCYTLIKQMYETS